MYYDVTLKDIFRTLPPAEQAELITLVGEAAAEEAAEAHQSDDRDSI
jgi:hypothetical protein